MFQEMHAYGMQPVKSTYHMRWVQTGQLTVLQPLHPPTHTVQLALTDDLRLYTPTDQSVPRGDAHG